MSLSKTFLVILASSTSMALAQVVNNVDNSPSYELVNNSDMAFMSLRIVTAGDDGPDGSYYVNKNFLPGTILFHNSKQKIVSPVRFNAAVNEIEIQRNGKVMALTPRDGMEVISENRSYSCVKSPTNGKYIFVESLVAGKYNLYDFFEIKVNKAPSDATLLNLEQKDEIEIKSNLYFQIKEGPILSLPKRKKDINELFDQTDLDILKKKKFNSKKIEDAISFFEYLNSK